VTILDWAVLIVGVAVLGALCTAIVHTVFEILRHDAEDQEDHW
jgi:hypothetical protein